MNVIIEATTFNHKLYHNLAIAFSKETRKKINFGVIRYDKVARNYLESQN